MKQWVGHICFAAGWTLAILFAFYEYYFCATFLGSQLTPAKADMGAVLFPLTLLVVPSWKGIVTGDWSTAVEVYVGAAVLGSMIWWGIKLRRET